MQNTPASRASSNLAGELIAIGLIFGVIVPAMIPPNGDTALSWIWPVHLTVGNAFIAYVQGKLLAWRFSIGMARGIGFMAAANCLASGASFFSLRWAEENFNLHIGSGLEWLRGMAIFTLALFVLIGWPLIALCLKPRGISLKRSFLANLLMQAGSCGVIFLGYWLISSTSLLTQTRIVSVTAMQPIRGAAVYFIAPDYTVKKTFLDGTPPREFLTPGILGRSDRLAIVRSEGVRSEWALAVAPHFQNESAESLVLLTNLSGLRAIPINNEESGSPAFQGAGPAVRLAETNVWQFRAGLHPYQGLRAENRENKETLHLSVDAPFMRWKVRNMTQLPNDQVVFQLGEDQICLFDPNTMQLALIARGRGPAVALEE